MTTRKFFGVFLWNGEGKYPVENAVFTFKNEKRAIAQCDKMNRKHQPDDDRLDEFRSGYVVRPVYQDVEE